MENKKICLMCGHQWKKRKEHPLSCPRCKSTSWNREWITKCQVCERNFNRIHLHHIDGNHDNNNRENYIFLCEDCHANVYHGIRNTRSIGKKNNKGRLRDYKDIKNSVKKNFYDDNSNYHIRLKLKELSNKLIVKEIKNEC